MEYVSSREIFDANCEAEMLAAVGWTPEHVNLRFKTENRHDLVAQFEALVTPEILELLKGASLAISSGEEVRKMWRNGGLNVPPTIPDMPACVIHHGKTGLIVVDIDVLNNYSMQERELVFVHELKHLEQFASGRLATVDGRWWWEGENYCSNVLVNKTSVGQGTYGAAFMQCMLPWELEAYEATTAYAISHDYKESFAYQHEFVIAAANAVAKIRAGGHPLPSPFIYDGLVLSREGVFGIGIADKEAIRNSLIECLSAMAVRVGRPTDLLAMETAWAILKVDYELVMAIVLGHGIYTMTRCGFYAEIYNEMPKSYFSDHFVEVMKEIAEEGK